jgi:hypothetical protein
MANQIEMMKADSLVSHPDAEEFYSCSHEVVAPHLSSCLLQELKKSAQPRAKSVDTNYGIYAWYI